MSESKFNQKLRQHLQAIAGIRVFRVESHGTTPGIPDNHYIADTGESGWIEMKEADSINPICIEYRPAQVPWLIQYSKMNGRCFTILHIPKADVILIVPGRYSKSSGESLRSTPHWRLSLKDSQVWSRIAVILRGSITLQPPQPKESSKNPNSLGQPMDEGPTTES